MKKRAGQRRSARPFDRIDIRFDQMKAKLDEVELVLKKTRAAIHRSNAILDEFCDLYFHDAYGTPLKHPRNIARRANSDSFKRKI
jgi:hypothetical protein